MHIPDGILSPEVNVTMAVSSVGFIAYSMKQVYGKVKKQNIMFAGALGAFIFAAQMLNFAVAKGTSGHFLGGVLAGVLLGPGMGTLVMTLIVLVQTLLFQDGGVYVMGANIFNIAVVGAFFGYYVFAMTRSLIEGATGVLFAAFVAGWITIVAASIVCSGQLAFAGLFPFIKLVGPMIAIHVKIGIAEGCITVCILLCLLRVAKKESSPLMTNLL